MTVVRPERTGWRDENISRRHREWGWNCPAVDLDFVMVEYHLGKPIGLIEYKHYHARMPNFQHPTYRALGELANSAGLAFILAFYWPEIWAFQVRPLNKMAAKHFDPNQVLTERQFVMTLYQMRELKMESALEKVLNDQLPAKAG